MLALGMDDVHGPADVINGIHLNVATPFSSVKRCCSTEKSLVIHAKPKATYSRLNKNPNAPIGRKEKGKRKKKI